MKSFLTIFSVQALILTLGVSKVFAQSFDLEGAEPSGVSLENPLQQPDIVSFLQAILDVIMIFAVPLIIFMIIYAGFTYVMARGNESEIGKAHKALLYAVIGGVIILGANIILAVIQGTVDSFR